MKIDLLVEHLIDCTDKERLTLFVQVKSARHGIEKFLGDLPFHEEIDHCFINMSPEQFDQVENKGSLVIIIRMKESDIGIKPCDDTGSFNLRVEDSIPVIQQAVEAVACRVPAPPLASK
jgi:hypothetical protein